MNSKSACERKTKYTKKEALLQQQMKRRQTGTIGGVYHCDRCHHWHITSKPKNRIPWYVWKKIAPRGE